MDKLPPLMYGTEERALEIAVQLAKVAPEYTCSFSDNLGDIDANNDIAASLNSLNLLQDDIRSKKSANMTECVPVPSSEHVAEIVGRQGCKIKALRAKTNTYIKTPVRGEEPVFVVTGRKEDVTRAKKEILSAADHFSAIRASRKCNLTSLASGLAGQAGRLDENPNHVTERVPVPYRVVGLVVGPKGATIKRIQHQTHTYIVTPSRDKEPVFEVTGLPENVKSARDEIKYHIVSRTGTSVTAPNPLQNFNPLDDHDLLLSLYKTGLSSVVSETWSLHHADAIIEQPMTSSTTSSGIFSSSSSCKSNSSSKSKDSPNTLPSIWAPSTDKDEGLGDSPSTDNFSIWAYPPSSSAAQNGQSGTMRRSPSLSPSETLLASNKDITKCYVCQDAKVTHAVIPCGHNGFCITCANKLGDTESLCPLCQKPVLRSLRIISMTS